MRPARSRRRTQRSGTWQLVAVTLAAVCSNVVAATPRNVLLVSIDSLRRDAVGAYADARATPHPDATPVLDRLAATGVRLTNANASSPWTLPSHVSLLTGQQTLVHQVESDVHALDARFPTLAEILRAHGYRTAGVFSGPYLEPTWGFGRGFERYRAVYDARIAEASRALAPLDARIAAAAARGDRDEEERLRWQRRRDFEAVRRVSHGDVSSERVTTAALEDLSTLAKGRAPWFAFVHYFDVHYDYVPPPPFDRRFDPDYRGTITGHGFFQNPAIAVDDDTGTLGGFVRRVGDRDLQHLRALYAGEVAWVDAHVGRLLAWLEARGLDRRTLVIVVSDHGDEFFEHGGIGHRRTVFEESLAIPMILRLPGTLPAGRAVDGAVSLADVAPTVLDVLGLPPRPELGGRSVLPLIRAQERPDDRGVISRLVRFYGVTAHLKDATTLPIQLATVQESFRTGSIKVIRRRAWPIVPPGLSPAVLAEARLSAHVMFRQEDLSWIDLTRAPREDEAAFSTDFSDPGAARALVAFRERYRALRALAKPAAVTGVDPALQEALKGLGYLEHASAPRSLSHGFVLPLPGSRVLPPHLRPQS